MPKSSFRKRPIKDEESSGDEAAPPPKTSKKAKTSSGDGTGIDSEGNPYWELSSKRRATVSTYKKMCLVNIREYYEDKTSGELKPGKKGISLSLEQYQALLKAAPAINLALGKMGHAIEDIDPEDAPEASAPQKKPALVAKKSNIEATSDEEEED